MCASQEGHTETLALLLANKADVHAATKVIITILSVEFILLWKQKGNTCATLASQEGHTETLALLLANNADVHAANHVIIIILSLEFYFIMEIEWIYLCNIGFTKRTY